MHVASEPAPTGGRTALRVGLSYDQGTPKYRLYLGALLAAAAQRLMEIEPVWLASADRPLDVTAARSVDALILTGGSDINPNRYGYVDVAGVCETFPGRDDAEIEALESAFERRIPILAICRGMQLINVFRGGSLIPDIPTVGAHRLPDEGRHEVTIEPQSMLSQLVRESSGSVTSSHHQAIKTLGRGLRATAVHADGTIEAIEWVHPMRKAWMLGVQWHPERMGLDEPLSGEIYRGFLQAAAMRVV